MVGAKAEEPAPPLLLAHSARVKARYGLAAAAVGQGRLLVSMASSVGHRWVTWAAPAVFISAVRMAAVVAAHRPGARVARVATMAPMATARRALRMVPVAVAAVKSAART